MPVAVAMLVICALAGCGGSGGGSNYQPSYAGVNPTVTVAPATANVPSGGRQQFVVTVTNSLYDTVTWEVNGVVGGNSTLGTIDVNGVYTAPLLAPSPAEATVTAVLNAADSFSGTSIVTITSVAFNNSSLKGNYVLGLKGISSPGLSTFYALSSITSDGNGNIIGGEEDLNESKSGYVQAPSVTGTYFIGADGRGVLNLNSSLGSFSYAIALRADGTAGVNESDASVVSAAGSLEAQAATVSAPSGNYAFGFAGANSACTSLDSIGVFGLSNGALSGLQDMNCGGTVTQSQALSGSYGNIDGLGRGTGSFSSTTGTSNFVYYVVSANRYRFLSLDTAAELLGSADLQTKTSFADSDFNGYYVIATSANSQTTVSNSLLEIYAAGGNVAAGFIDTNSTGIVTSTNLMGASKVSSTNLSGAYSLSSTGYVVGTFNTVLDSGATSFPFSMYLVSPTQAYYLDLQTQVQGRIGVEGVTGGGMVYAQATPVLGNIEWAGSYTTQQFGYSTTGGVFSPVITTSVTGQISSNGNGVLVGTLDLNGASGFLPGLQAQGSYNVGIDVPGRTSVKITTSNGTRNYTAYIVNQGQVQLLEIDGSITAGGNTIVQF